MGIFNNQGTWRSAAVCKEDDLINLNFAGKVSQLALATSSVNPCTGIFI